MKRHRVQKGAVGALTGAIQMQDPSQELYACNANYEWAHTKPTDSTHTNAHRDTCKLCKSMWKSIRRIQIKPVQDYHILTAAHTLCWALKIPNWSRKEDRQMNGQGPRIVHHEIRTMEMKVGACWKHRGRGTWGVSGTGIRTPGCQWALPKC